MKNISAGQVRRCIVKGQGAFHHDLRTALGDSQARICADLDIISRVKPMREDQLKALAKYYGVSRITDIFVRDSSDAKTYWLVCEQPDKKK